MKILSVLLVVLLACIATSQVQAMFHFKYADPFFPSFHAPLGFGRPSFVDYHSELARYHNQMNKALRDSQRFWDMLEAFPRLEKLSKTQASDAAAASVTKDAAQAPAVKTVKPPAPLSMHVEEHEDRVALKATIEQVRPEDIELTLEQRTLTLKVSRKSEGACRASQREFLERRMTVPEGVTEADIRASIKDGGVLEIVVPKPESARIKRIAIENHQQPEAAAPAVPELPASVDESVAVADKNDSAVVVEDLEEEPAIKVAF